MIRKLRRKFILINMVTVGVVLLAVLTVIFLTNYQQQRNESYDAMRMALSREEGTPPERININRENNREKKIDQSAKLLPVFSVTLDEAGEILFVDTGNVEVSDKVVENAVTLALAQSGKEGFLSALDMRYLREDTPHGIKLAFLDVVVERSTMANLLFTLLLVGFGAFAVLFVVSVLLANWALRPVKRAWEQQQRFIADASHELKTPITVMLANLGIILAHPENTITQQTKWIENTKTEATHMKKLVENLLFLAKADAMQAPGEYTRLSLSDTVWNCVLPFEPVAFEQGVGINSNIDPNIFMMGDQRQIQQLIVILLDNACKYAGKRGSVTIEVKHTQDKIQISVQNTGIPIEPEHLPHVFERFYRTDEARVRSKGGYGLGLSIAKEIVEAHHGRITAASDAEKGTVFTITFSSPRK